MEYVIRDLYTNLHVVLIPDVMNQAEISSLVIPTFHPDFLYEFRIKVFKWSINRTWTYLWNVDVVEFTL